MTKRGLVRQNSFRGITKTKDIINLKKQWIRWTDILLCLQIQVMDMTQQDRKNCSTFKCTDLWFHNQNTLQHNSAELPPILSRSRRLRTQYYRRILVRKPFKSRNLELHKWLHSRCEKLQVWGKAYHTDFDGNKIQSL